MRPVVVWFRDDLRIADNPALGAAAQSGRPVIAFYLRDLLSPGFRKPGAAQDWMLHQALAGLKAGLATLDATLIIRAGAAGEEIPRFVQECQAAAIYWNRRHSQPEIAVDSRLKQVLRAAGIAVESFHANLLHEPSRLLTGAEGPFKVYSPFWRAFEKLPPPRKPVPAPTSLMACAAMPAGLALEQLQLLPEKPDWAGGLRAAWPVGENGAHALLAQFLKGGLRGYADGRDMPGQPNVSRLSPYLRFGMISPFQIWQALDFADAPARDIEKFRKELGWREFSWHLLHHNPDLASKNFDDRFDGFPWLENSQAAERWRRGETGYPLVDAGMRELWQTGYMHNRVRMVVASFLIKHLMIDWRIGEQWFWDTLVDGDPANNAASWQWVAGCGADAAPYFRIFNPVIQGEKFDGVGDYVRRFVPELSRLPDRFLHKPWEAPALVLAEAGVTLGKTYPKPLVDHPAARDRALHAFETLKKAG